MSGSTTESMEDLVFAAIRQQVDMVVREEIDKTHTRLRARAGEMAERALERISVVMNIEPMDGCVTLSIRVDKRDLTRRRNP